MAQRARALRLPLPEHLPTCRGGLGGALPRPEADGRVGPTPARLAERGKQARDADAYDAHFGVERVSDDPGGVFLAGLSTALRDVLADVDAHGTGLDANQWRTVLRVPGAVLAFTSPGAAPVPGRGDGDRPPLGTPGEPASLLRWRTGHRLFFTLTQALIVALSPLRAAAGERDADGAREALEFAVLLNRASAVAMRYASDFPAAEYPAVVRPSMEPPFTAPGFSGLQGRDHRHLVRLFGGLREFRSGPVAAGDSYRRFVASVGELHAAHRLVCSRFGGGELPSLRTRGRGSPPHPARTAGQVLETLSAQRLALLSPGRAGR
ncbi:hypothetical protein [Actinorugispora endophytica]|uniref:Uncharacterized protein n=1 Tax=Actinorugispora endophytica TaxID=1605990 RepID=A0A4R6VC37_9ACTN|nr:hypothetical protein [Actinorugispora endophytica]TDQ54306.1 hypothetical protein EV190_102140 [Actinorugispora endophytica]